MPNLKAIPLLWLTVFILPGHAGAQQHPILQRGFSPEKMYQFDQIDSVNLLNGNITVSIPLGLRYPVGGGFDYGFTLTYNSKIWDVKEQSGDSYGEAIPNRGSNAGLGWSISFGRLLDPDDPDNDFDPTDWVYEGPDGAQRVFYERLNTHAPDVPSDSANLYQYTRDATYLRMRALSTTVRMIDFPDGESHRFERYAPGKWRITAMTDAFGNGVSFEYLFDSALQANIWKLTDSHGRVQKVVFGGDPANWYSQLIHKLLLTAAGGGTAEYTFNYSPNLVTRSCLDTWPYNSGAVGVPLLSSVILPDGSTWSPEYYATHPDVCYAHGSIRALTLPTLGRIEWTYGYYELPLFPCTTSYWFQTSAGVKTRQFRGAAGEDLGLWTYTPGLSGPPPNSAGHTCEGPDDDFPYDLASEQLSNTVVTPLKDRVVHYFSVYPGAPFDAGTASSPYEYGLPVTRLESDDTGTRFLSTRTFDCDAGGGNCQMRRSTYFRYEHDAPLPLGGCSRTAEVGKSCLDTQRRVASERVAYHDDGGRSGSVDRSNFDGLGHYRLEHTDVDFESNEVRTDYVQYNLANGTYVLDANLNRGPGYDFKMVPTTALWVLPIQDYRLTTEAGVTAGVSQAVDPNTGWVSRRRIHRLSNGGESNEDILVELTPDGRGNLLTERYYGGDTQWIATGNIHSLPLPQPPSYQIDHSHQYGALATSQYKDATGGASGPLAFFAVNRTIDFWTGLPSASRDTAGIEEGYTYDTSGRLTKVEPLGNPRDALTTYTYCTATSNSGCGGKAEVVVARKTSAGGPEITATRWRFDALGRPISEEERIPPGGYQARTFAYNGMGWRTFVSERGAAGGTSYLGYDPFGRPGTIRPADGSAHDVSLSYLGARQVRRTVRVATSESGAESAATTTEIYDPLGRPKEVTEPNGVKTRYDYEIGDRLRKVCQNATGAGTATCGQARVFTYDQRGFLLSEQHPEKGGSSGNGVVSYLSYNARGHAERRIDGTNDLTLSYDRAERLLAVRETGGSQRPLKSFTYGTGATVADRGKVKTAKRYNYVGAPFNATVEVQDTYLYGGRGGRVSQRDTQHFFNGAAKEGFRLTAVYDELGNLASQGYPDCIAGDCAALDAPRTVSFTYSQGRLATVPGFTGTATATNGANISQITYHPNGMVHQVPHANGMLYTVGRDLWGMARPSSFQASKGATIYWNTGTHTYDGAGNLEGTGEFTYAYDLLSRVVQSTMYGAGTTQGYTYDVYGNIQSVTTSGSTVGTPTSSATNRLTSGSYDPAGNLLSWASNLYEHDAFNQLKRYVAGSEDWRYIYTADDERFWSYRVGNPPAVSTASIWALRGLDGQVLRRYDAHLGWGTYEDYVYREGQLLAAAHTPVAPAPKTGMWHFHLDHLGTPRMVTNQNGASIGFHRYYPFGQEQTALQEGETRKFTGHERDLANLTGTADDLDYMHARHYSPLTGRFLSTDPVLQIKRAIKKPQQWNRYAYALGNPLKYIDPKGEDVSIGVKFTSDKGITYEEKQKILEQVKQWYLKRHVGKVYVFDVARASHGGSFLSRLFNRGYATINVSSDTSRKHTPGTVFAGSFRHLPPDQFIRATSNSLIHETAAHHFKTTLGNLADLMYYDRQTTFADNPAIRARYGTVADSLAYDHLATRGNVTGGPIPIHPEDAAIMQHELGPVRVEPPDLP